MKKYKRYLFNAIAVMLMGLTGCGTELYELTAEEENLIVHAAAYYVAKYNIQQKDGVTGVELPDSFEDETENSESGSGNAGSADVGNQSKPADDMAALAELIGLEGKIKISYEGSYVANTYKEGSADIVDAEKGKTFYVMKLKLTNITGSDIEINNALKSPIVKLVCDSVKVKSEVTFLTSDFSTYQGVVKAVKSVETILLFEFSEKSVEKIVSPTLQITIGNSTKSIKL